MSEFEVELSNVYYDVSSSNEKSSVSRLYELSQLQNFVCRVLDFNGNSLCISHSPADTLNDLYEKVGLTMTNGVAYDLHKEYSIYSYEVPEKEDRRVIDIFVCSNKGEIKSIPRTSRVRLHDYISSNPAYFAMDPSCPLIRTYTLYVVDNISLEQMKLITPSMTYWDMLFSAFSKSFSCKIMGSKSRI